MFKKFLLLLCLSFLYQQTLFSHERLSVLPEEFKDDKVAIVGVKYSNYHLEMLNFASKDFDITGVDLKAGYIDLAVSQQQLDFLKSNDYSVVIRSEKNLLIAPDSQYKNPQEIEDFLKEMNQTYPEISKLVSIGNSVEGRNIWAIKISDNPDIDEVEPVVLYNSMHHAREVMTPEIGVDMVEYLLTRYGRDERVTEWVGDNEIWVVPMLNVDGNNRVWSGDSMWRKNTRNGHGVDINRNYPHEWGACNGSSGSKWSQTYRGPSAASEPETRALMGLVANIKPVFDISYHSYSELVLYPYGCQGQRTETHQIISKIGRKIGEILDYRPGTPWEILYGVDGGDVDWMYAAHQVLPYVIELNSSREGFQPRYDVWRDRTVEKNRPAWQYLLNRLEGTGVRGILKNRDGEVMNDYSVEVLKINKDLTQTKIQDYRGNPDGSFHIILNEGEYKLNFRYGARSMMTETISLNDTRVELNPVIE